MSPVYNRPPYYYPPRPPYYYGYPPNPYLYTNPLIGGFFGGLAGSLLTPIVFGRPPYYRYY